MNLTDKQKELIIAFTYCKGWTADRITRVLWDVKPDSKPFKHRRKFVTKAITEVEMKLNCKTARLLDIIEKGDEVLKEYYFSKSILNLTDMV